MASKVIMILACIALGWTIITLFWLTPMTNKISRRQRDGEKRFTGFRICVLLFASVVSGILLLCDNYS